MPNGTFHMGYVFDRSIKFLGLILLIVTGSLVSHAQKTYPLQAHTTILGNSGLITTPTARFGADRQMQLSYFHVPEKYELLHDKKESSDEQHISFSLMFLPFMEASASLIRPYNQWWGIGDRSYKVRFRLCNEKKVLPAIAIGIHDAISSNTRQGAVYFVGSKKVDLKNGWTIDGHLGYAFDITDEWLETTHLFQDDSKQNETLLTGVFGGVDLSYRRYNLLLEYDTEKVNLGTSVFIWKYFYAQLSLLGFDALSAGISARYLFGDRLVKK